MKKINLKLPIFLTVLSLVLLAFCNTCVYASDYQYKVLDTKYNPSAIKLIDGTLEKQIKEKPQKAEHKKGFDFVRFLAFIVALMFPFFVLKYSCRTFVSVFNELKEKGIDYVPEEDEKEENSETELETNDKDENLQLEEIEIPMAKQPAITSLELKEEDTAESEEPSVTPIESIDNNIEDSIEEQIVEKKEISEKVTSPIKSKNTEMLNKARLMQDKGLCIVKYDDKYALVGYIQKKVFLLQKFDKLRHTEIRSRWTETVNDKERYIVRLGTSYKALVEVGDEDINLLIEL